MHGKVQGTGAAALRMGSLWMATDRYTGPAVAHVAAHAEKKVPLRYCCDVCIQLMCMFRGFLGSRLDLVLEILSRLQVHTVSLKRGPVEAKGVSTCRVLFCCRGRAGSGGKLKTFTVQAYYRPAVTTPSDNSLTCSSAANIGFLF